MNVKRKTQTSTKVYIDLLHWICLIKKGLELRALALNRSFHDHAILQFAKRCIIAYDVRILGNGCRFSRHLFGVYASHGLSLVV